MAESIIDGTGSNYYLRVNPDGSILIQLTGSGGYYYQDKATSALPVIAYEHHEVHDGNHFNIRNFSTPLNSGLTINFGFFTPNGSKWTHLLWKFEGATLSGGTPISPMNNNRNAVKSAGTLVYLNPVVSGAVGTVTSGLLIGCHSKGFEAATPSKASLSSDTQQSDEWILRSGTAYLIAIKSVGANNIIDYEFTGYDHTDRIKQF